MATSSTELTRIGFHNAGVGKQITITAKTAATVSPVKKVRRMIHNIARGGIR